MFYVTYILTGSGQSKKIAKHNAAEMLLKKIGPVGMVQETSAMPPLELNQQLQPGFNPQQPPGLNLQQPPGLQLQQPPGLHPQQLPGLNPQQPPGLNLQQPPGLNLQQQMAGCAASNGGDWSMRPIKREEGNGFSADCSDYDNRKQFMVCV